MVTTYYREWVAGFPRTWEFWDNLPPSQRAYFEAKLAKEVAKVYRRAFIQDNGEAPPECTSEI